MKKYLTLLLMLLLLKAPMVIACTEDCDEQCSDSTFYSSHDVRKSCKDLDSFYRNICIMAGGSFKECGENSYNVDQCVKDTLESYYKDCIQDCDQCDNDDPSGCFIENIQRFKN